MNFLHKGLYFFMKKHLIFCVCYFLLKVAFAQHNPNIILILADDLGYGDVGVYGQKIIETPHIDALASSGMLFRQHYSGAPVCAPSRCVLLTGKHLGHAYIRGNDEWAERGDVWNLKAMNANPRLEGQRPMPDSLLTIAEILQKQGYTTALVGKWGLGAPMTESTPNKQGFDFFYGYNCQRQAHTLYPTHLWRNEEIAPLRNQFVNIHQSLPAHLDPTSPASYTEFELTDYAPEVMHREAVSFLRQSAHRPFFLYYASPLPHVPLQAPRRWVEYYEKKLGKEAPYTNPKASYYPNRTPNATYAAMISYLDEQVGDLVKTLKDLHLYDNTIIVFSSDNGPSYAGGVNPSFFKSGGPFQEQFGRGKGFVYEGGIRVPMIVSWPQKIKAGTTTNHIGAFYDFVPTVCELIGISAPASDGISYLPTLLQKKQRQHQYLYWEFPETGGQQAIRMGKWKAIRTNIQKGNLEIALYNLQKDPLESINVAKQNPRLVRHIEQLFQQNHTPSPLKKFRMKALGDSTE